MTDQIADCPRCSGRLRITQIVTFYDCDAILEDGEVHWDSGGADWGDSEFSRAECRDCDHFWDSPEELAADLRAVETSRQLEPPTDLPDGHKMTQNKDTAVSSVYTPSPWREKDLRELGYDWTDSPEEDEDAALELLSIAVGQTETGTLQEALVSLREELPTIDQTAPHGTYDYAAAIWVPTLIQQIEDTLADREPDDADDLEPHPCAPIDVDYGGTADAPAAYLVEDAHGAVWLRTSLSDGAVSVEIVDLGEAGLRSCDECDRVTDAGAWPDWVNGVCELCDPELLDELDAEL